MIDIYTVSVLVFFAVLGILIWRDRKNIEIKSKIIIMRRTKRFRTIIDDISKPSTTAFRILSLSLSAFILFAGILFLLNKNILGYIIIFLSIIAFSMALGRPWWFWKSISTAGVVLALFFMIYGFYMLTASANMIFQGIIKQPGVHIVLPSLGATSVTGPGYILIPFWFWFIVIAAILVPHELSHGIMARAEKIRLKSVGLLLLAIFPGAFVEPDENALKKSRLIKKLRIFAAGSLANFLVAFFVFTVTAYLIWPNTLENNNILIINVTEGSPAALAGISQNTIITEINGKPVTPTYAEFISGKGYFQDELPGAKPGDTVVFKSYDKEYNVTLSEKNGKAYMGIYYTPIYKQNSILAALLPLLTMIWLFSFGVGLFNILPLYPLDGGMIVSALAERFASKNAGAIVKTLSSITLFIILYNIFGPLIIA